METVYLVFVNVFSVFVWFCTSSQCHCLTPSPPPCALAHQFVCHTEAIADIVFLVDGSWSIGRVNFKLVRTFLENLVNAFDVDIDKTRIGMPQPCFLSHR